MILNDIYSVPLDHPLGAHGQHYDWAQMSQVTEDNIVQKYSFIIFSA